MIVSSKGQITLPAKFRKRKNIHPGDRITLNYKTGKLSKMPTKNEWRHVLKDIPVEKVDMDPNGNYDPKKAPHFHNWMVNG